MSALHQHGQMVKVHYEHCGERCVRTGRLYGNYEGEGSVSITVARDCRISWPESRVV